MCKVLYTWKFLHVQGMYNNMYNKVSIWNNIFMRHKYSLISYKPSYTCTWIEMDKLVGSYSELLPREIFF